MQLLKIALEKIKNGERLNREEAFSTMYAVTDIHHTWADKSQIHEALRGIIENSSPADLMDLAGSTSSHLYSHTNFGDESFDSYLHEKLLEGMDQATVFPKSLHSLTNWKHTLIVQTLRDKKTFTPALHKLAEKGLELVDELPEHYRFEAADRLRSALPRDAAMRTETLYKMYESAAFLSPDAQNYAYAKVYFKLGRNNEIALDAQRKAADTIQFIDEKYRHTAVMNIANNTQNKKLIAQVLELAIDALPASGSKQFSNALEILKLAPTKGDLYTRAMKAAFDNILNVFHTSPFYNAIAFCETVPKSSTFFQPALQIAIDHLSDVTGPEKRYEAAMKIKKLSPSKSRVSTLALREAFEAVVELPQSAQEAKFADIHAMASEGSRMHQRTGKALEPFAIAAAEKEAKVLSVRTTLEDFLAGVRVYSLA